jgi:uncharacterized oxidoreductase
MPRFQSNELIKITRRIFVAAGTPEDIADIVAGALVKANLIGYDSHGIWRITRYIMRIRNGGLDPAARPEVERQTNSVAVVNGNWGFGQLGARLAVEYVSRLAPKCGVACVALHRTNHIGRVGEYAEMLASEGLISMVLTSVAGQDRQVAPYGGRERIFGTNPMAWALPVRVSRPPLVVDFATAATAEGKLAVAMSRGEQVEPGLVLDRYGNPSTEPNSFFDGGTLLPFGGHKGYGLTLMIQLMTNVLTDYENGSYRDSRFKNPSLFTAWSVEAFMALEQFVELVEDWLQYIKRSKTAKGFDEILLPGEPEARIFAKRSKEGIDIPEPTWREIEAIAGELGISI